MSHSMLLVVGDDVDEQLVPFDENLRVERYIERTKEQVIEDARTARESFKTGACAEYLANPEKYIAESSNEYHKAYVTEQFPLVLEMSDEELYEYETRHCDEQQLDEHGNIWSTYNPQSKWDWYTAGGRWENSLISLDGKAFETDSGIKGKVVLKGEPPFAVLKDGVWHERGEMGWFGVVLDEKVKEDWDKEFQEIWDSIPVGTLLTVVDVHI